MLNKNSKGFTLTELMITIGIILVMVSLTIPAISVLNNTYREYINEIHVVAMQHAITSYVSEYEIFGDLEKSGDLEEPLKYLYHRRLESDRDLELLNSQVVKRAGDGWVGCSVAEATHMRDGWDNAQEVQIVNDSIPGLSHRKRTAFVLVKSSNNDLRVIDVSEGVWHKASFDGVDDRGMWKYTIR